MNKEYKLPDNLKKEFDEIIDFIELTGKYNETPNDELIDEEA
jgi:hypothetical protein